MRGRLLSSYKNIEFNYDGSGERFSKTTFNGTTRYITLNGKLLWEENSDNKLISYLYGATGLIGCIIEGTQYYYAKNMFGDVVALIRTSDNATVAQYVYDAWGNHKVYDSNGNENTDPYFVGNLNPIRYRSYYWDSDIGMYYLHTRWYDPEIGRFINLDQLAYLDPETVNGLNLYAYCGNNPVMYADPNGTFWGIFLAVAAILLFTPIGGTVVQAATSVVSYVVMAGLSLVNEDIREDMDRIHWNPFNSNEEYVIKSNKVSFYKGVPVIITNFRSGTVGCIFLEKGETVDTVKHEFGHVPQFLTLGMFNYLLTVGIPSWQEWGKGKYWASGYQAPWESMAEMFGGANNIALTPKEKNRAVKYLISSLFLGTLIYLFYPML